MEDIGYTLVVVAAIIAVAAVAMTEQITEQKACPAQPTYVCDGVLVKQKAADGNIVYRCTTAKK